MIKERQQAAKAIIDFGHLPAGMELFVADNESLLKTIFEWIDSSDLFIFIHGIRYGTIGNGNIESYLEMELNYALERQLPIFILSLNEKERKKRLANKENIKLMTEDNRAKFEELSSRIKNLNLPISYFEDHKDVAAEVGKIIRNIEIKNEISGWVREYDGHLNLLRKPSYQSKPSFKSKTIKSFEPFTDKVNVQIHKDTTILIEIYKTKKHLKFVVYFEYKDEAGSSRWVGFNNSESVSHKQGSVENTRQVIDQESFTHSLKLNVIDEIGIAFPEIKDAPKLLKSLRFRADGNFVNDEIEFVYKILEISS